ncbi:MAG: hypothetical protein Q8873_08940 [Bacillota bacterium]|nr:hypothetical protein [Bacillota bacterium]
MKKNSLAVIFYLAVTLAHFVIYIIQLDNICYLLPNSGRSTERAIDYFLIFFFVLISFLFGIFMKKKGIGLINMKAAAIIASVLTMLNLAVFGVYSFETLTSDLETLLFMLSMCGGIQLSEKKKEKIFIITALVLFNIFLFAKILIIYNEEFKLYTKL